QNMPSAEEKTAWGENGSLKMRMNSYVSRDLPPLELVTSVRAVVRRGDDEVLVVREPNGKIYILPGGRREAGEDLEETLRREVLEETGWTLDNIDLLGCIHFHILVPKPDGYAYSYPDFFQLVYVARAVEYRPEAMQYDEYVQDSAFHPLAEVRAMPLREGQQRFLEAAASYSLEQHP
ncbi:MAG: NUDIX hydrolase, partial [Ktedonobacteraceae bacterium]|nr:NUDIX hydrolase [Ktedonobacteraceae bacterium]